MKRILASICLILLVAYCVFSQETDSSQTDVCVVKPGRVALVMGGYGALVIGAHLQNYNSWWRGERGSFHFADNTAHTFGADKLGHLYFSFLGSDMVGRSLIWAGLEPRDAFLYSGALIIAFQLYVEIEDAFHPELGLCVGDVAADFVGAGFPFLQHSYPPLQSVTFKWNFIRSERFKRGSHRTVIDDYESQYHWLAANVKELLPDVVPSFWPRFLGVALGYGEKNLDNGRERELYVALDYDFTKLPGEGSFLSAVKHVLNYFHFPAPTIRLTPGIITYGLRF